MIHEILIGYLPYIIGIAAFLIFFNMFRKWNIEKFKEKNKQITKDEKVKASLPDQDIAKYIAYPEESIKLLRQQRVILEKSHDEKGIQSIDNQIKMLETLAQIPAPVRPYVAKMGQALMKKVSGMVDQL